MNLALRLGQHLTDDGLDPPLAPPDSLTAPRAAIAQLVADLRPVLCTAVDLTPPNLAQASCRTLGSSGGARPSSSFFFLSRFYEALHYYAGLFDALEESVGSAQSAERHTLEREVLGRAIVSTIASQGHLPVAKPGAEHSDKLDQGQRGTWGTWLARAGLQPVPVSSNVIAVSAQLLAA